MTRISVYLIIIVFVMGFSGLVYYGWTNRWGGSMDNTILERQALVLTMPQMDKELTLSATDLDDEIWKQLSPLTVPLLHQVTVVPWARNLVPQLDIRAFHNGKDVYFLFEWKDTTASRRHDIGIFPDGVAVSFSLSDQPPSASIMMGFQSPVNIWQWKADLDAQIWDAGAQKKFTPNIFYTYASQADLPYAGEEPSSACQDLLAVQPGTVTLKDSAAVSGRGLWRDGAWQVIIKRTMVTGNVQRDVQLAPGRMHLTFAVWDGEKGDRGSRKSISEWVILSIQSAAADRATMPSEPAVHSESLSQVGYSEVGR